ncbi:putative bifunctional diguanylate cyclase/phosphodiesterase [Shewanella waksmanii]|uniref:putative bifunctional diguanylate cyclase/phosphodiesterase n=1 Tax=Shewanella waksmanii TaxID=213783 RepID=UPI00048AA2AC|nr:bifunctional diguanylate cyclase/phosphodiesterase [Shewanella waksmanii]
MLANIDWLTIILIGLLAAGICYGYWHRRTQKQYLSNLVTKLKSDGSVDINELEQAPSLYHGLVNQLIKKPSADSVTPLNHDKLTGLLNRVGLKQRLAPLMPITHGCFILIDVYRFRYVNDLFGFHFGDKLLVALSERLSEMSLTSKLMARMNQDEFLLFDVNPWSRQQIEDLQQQLQAPIVIDHTPVSLQFQIGYLDLALHHGDVSQMLRRVDLAVNRAKGLRQRIADYQLGEDAAQFRQLNIINRLPKALAQNELYLVYQPKVNLSDNSVTHVEALIRWESEDLGRVSPAEFIPLLECAGMIELVSHWVIDTVLAQQAYWQQVGMTLQVAVNLSIEDIDNAVLKETLFDLLEDHKLPPHVIALEVTESQIMHDMPSAIAALEHYRKAGINISVDDFGTGHSSIAYLKHLPIDEVKIDKAFLDGLGHDPQALHVLQSAVELAKGLGYGVIVEGVETPEQLQLIRELAVDKIQGELLAKPMTAPELEMNWKALNAPSN